MKHIRMLFVVFFMSICCGVLSCGAESSGDIFYRANRLYDDGDYQEAAKLYEGILSQGVISGNIYYNLGNAYYKMGKTGKALLNYERARKFIPHNEDLFANISFVESALNVELPEETYPLYEKICLGIRNALSVKAWFILSAGLFFGLCVILGIGSLSYGFRQRSYALSGIAAVLFIVSLALFMTSYTYNRNFKEGIIVIPEAEVRYSPSYSGVVAFKLAEGMKAQIIRREGEWTHIRLTRGKNGWIESEAIESVW